MLFRPRYGRIGLFALPYLWLFELMAPIIEVTGIITIILAACFGALGSAYFVQFMIFGYGFATLISIGSVLQEEMTYIKIQRLAGCHTSCELLFPRTLSLSTNTYDLASSRSMAIFARRDMKWRPLTRIGPKHVDVPSLNAG
jgi:hypothetical protein